MRLGVFTTILSGQPLSEAVKYFASLGVNAVELGCGGWPGKAHADPAVLLADKGKLKELKSLLDDNGMIISCLSTHGNPVHPDKAVAASYHADFEGAVRLAAELGVEVVTTFSGCPGDHEGAKYPNWVTCPWPGDFLEILDWQWNEKLIPYWTKTAKFAASAGIKKIAFEMHPGFCVYNPETMLKIRAAVGDVIGANFDPSHLWWQGMDPVACIRKLAGAIYHFHAKDVKIDPINTSNIGVLDMKHYTDELNRSWVFRALGYGHNMQEWRDIVSALRLVGYDHVISIEHEDSLMSVNEGLEKAIYFLRQAIINEPKPTSISWA